MRLRSLKMYFGNFKPKQTAFTLVEVLVAMTIFSIVIAISVSSYRFALQQMGKKVDKAEVRALASLKVLRQQMKGVKPYFVSVYDKPSDMPFFVGSQKEITFITEASLLTKSPLSIVSLFSTDQGISYCELPFGSVGLPDYRQGNDRCENPTVLFEGENVRFRYFGWKDQFEFYNYFSEYFAPPTKPKPTWYSNYDGRERGITPIFIEILFDTNNGESESFKVRLPEFNYLERNTQNAFEG